MTDNEKTWDAMDSSGELSDDEIEEVTGGVQGRTGNFNKSHDTMTAAVIMRANTAACTTMTDICVILLYGYTKPASHANIRRT